MPWGKMDDKFHRHEKVRALRREKAGREALGVWVYWWSWCLDDAALDGAVPLDVFPEADMKGAALLVKHGLWHQEAECFRFHNFNKWNPTPEQRAHKKENDRTKIAAKRAALDADVACDIAATLPDVACDSLSTSANVARESPPRARALGSPSPSPSPSLPNPQPLIQTAPPALVCVGVPQAKTTEGIECAFGDVAEGGKNPEPPPLVQGWHPQRLASVLSAGRTLVGGGPYGYRQTAWQELYDACAVFAEANPDDPADAAAWAFAAWAKTEWARKAKWPVSAFLADAGKHLGG